MTFIDPDLGAVSIVVITTAAVMWLSGRKHPVFKSLLNWIPAILFAYIIPAAITHLFHLDYASVDLHNTSRNVIIPLAILAVMSALSFDQLKIIGLRPISLFVIGSFTIAILAPLLLLLAQIVSPSLLDLMIADEYWKGMVPIVGSWIGGSTSQLVLKELVECPEGIFLSILVLDNILVNIWTILMFQYIQKSDFLNRTWNIKDVIPDFIPDHLEASKLRNASSAMTVLVVLGSVVIIQFLSLPFLWVIVLLSLEGLLLGNFVPKWNHTLVLKGGGVLIVVIMAILGLKLNFSSFSMPWTLVAFVTVWLVLHFMVMIFVARWMGLHSAWVPIASMANLGGISTAPAVTAAYNEEWMPYAIILAILSMVTGTAWGFLTIFLFNYFFL